VGRFAWASGWFASFAARSDVNLRPFEVRRLQPDVSLPAARGVRAPKAPDGGNEQAGNAIERPTSNATRKCPALRAHHRRSLVESRGNLEWALHVTAAIMRVMTNPARTRFGPLQLQSKRARRAIQRRKVVEAAAESNGRLFAHRRREPEWADAWKTNGARFDAVRCDHGFL